MYGFENLVKRVVRVLCECVVSTEELALTDLTSGNLSKAHEGFYARHTNAFIVDVLTARCRLLEEYAKHVAISVLAELALF